MFDKEVKSGLHLYRGFVVNNNPKEAKYKGRVQVKIPNFGTDDKESIPEEDLYWCEVMQPIDFIGFHDDKGWADNDDTRVGANKGSGKDGEGRKPGFGTNIHIALGVGVVVIFDSGYDNAPLIIGTFSAHNEFNPQANPLNRIQETISGHQMQIDDNPGKERILTHHRTGTETDYQANGDIKETIVHDSVQEIRNDNKQTIKGNSNISIDGNLKHHTGGDRNEDVGAGMTLSVTNNCVITASKILLN